MLTMLTNGECDWAINDKSGLHRGPDLKFNIDILCLLCFDSEENHASCTRYS